MNEFESESVIPARKKKRISDSGSELDWAYMTGMMQNHTIGPNLCELLRLPKVQLQAQPRPQVEPGQINCAAILFASMPLVLFALNLLYEELKLDLLYTESMPLLARLLNQIAKDLRLREYVEHYWRDFPSHCSLNWTQASQINKEDITNLSVPSYLSRDPPHIFAHLYSIIQRNPVEAYPYVNHVNDTSRNIIQLTTMIIYGDENQLPSKFLKQVVPFGSLAEISKDTLSQDIGLSSCPMPYKVVQLMTQMGITPRMVMELPDGISLLLNSALYSCRSNPPVDWPEAAYKLIYRQDLASQCRQIKPPQTAGDSRTYNLNSSLPHNAGPSNRQNRKVAVAPRLSECDHDDGMEGMDMELLMCRFIKDQRIPEVRKLLRSSQPVTVAIVQSPEVSDHEFIVQQEEYLYAVCSRTMALPLGRGMFTLHTATPVVTETLPIPRLCLTGKFSPKGTTVDLTHIEVEPNMNLWPLFHNGVAAGLRIAPNALDINSTWMVFNEPKGSEVPTEHAGFLMGLGLNGHLNNLDIFKMFEYLIKCHEMTSVGLLLGVAACKRGTMDVDAIKLMSIHIEALIPPTSIEMDMPQNIQVAALLGMGLVYEGTAHHHIAEVLLSEIGRPSRPEMENSVNRESYSLAAGLALGLVCLGKGDTCGLGDLAILDTLHYYMVGGHRRPLTGSQNERYKPPNYQILEGDSVNIDVTSPGATLALGMMYFNTENTEVADWMKPPDTQYLLDSVRPDFLMLRTVSRALILWDKIEPRRVWVERNIPTAIQSSSLMILRRRIDDYAHIKIMNRAYFNILGGGLMAIGLRYAGSGNKSAFITLMFYSKLLTQLAPRPIAGIPGKSLIETCLNIIVIASAMVMSGTGNLEVIRLCRHMRSRVGSNVVTYGSHMATHMALGLIFLGGGRYTLRTSPSAIAALICAFFPKFPTHSNDNRYHLQAFRHLYVLAVEPRLLMPRNIDTGQLCHANLVVTYWHGTRYQSKIVKMKAPCILPELSKLEKVVVEDDRYWPIEFQQERNWDHLENLMENSGCLDVKQRAGCLSRLEDPQGFRSLFAKTLTSEISWSVKAESICSFTSDPTMLSFVRYFLEQGHTCEKSPAERELVQTMTLLTYECVTQDKLAILPIWITLAKGLQSLQFNPNSYLTWQLKLVSAQVLSQKSALVGGNTIQLVGTDLGLSLRQHTSKILEEWETDLEPVLEQYLTAGKVNADSETVKKLTTYLNLFNIPSPYMLQVVGAFQDPVNCFSMLQKLERFHVPASTVNKLVDLKQNFKLHL